MDPMGYSSTHLVQCHCTTRGLHPIAEPTGDPRHAGLAAGPGARAAAVAARGAGSGGAGAADQGTARK